MHTNHNQQEHNSHSYVRSTYKKYDDFCILEPAPDIEFALPDDEDDESSDYSLMENAIDPNYEE